MERRRTLFAGILMAITTSSSAACGMITGLSDYEVGDDANEASANHDGNAGGDGASSSSGGDGGGDVTGKDGALPILDSSPDEGLDDATPSDGGAVDDSSTKDSGGFFVSDPNLVACTTGLPACSLTTQRCCVGVGCISNGGSCTGATVECDEKADCSNGEMCCLEAVGTLKVQCEPNCQPGDTKRIPVCKLDSECPNHEKCLPIQCTNRTFGSCNGALPQQGGCQAL